MRHKNKHKECKNVNKKIKSTLWFLLSVTPEGSLRFGLFRWVAVSNYVCIGSSQQRVKGTEDWRGGLVPYVSILCVISCDSVIVVHLCIYIVRERRERLCMRHPILSLSLSLWKEKVENGNVAAWSYVLCLAQHKR